MTRYHICGAPSKSRTSTVGASENTRIGLGPVTRLPATQPDRRNRRTVFVPPRKNSGNHYDPHGSNYRVGSSLKPLEVLLVEDNVGDIMLMRQSLAREPVPISVHVAIDGSQAMQILSARQFEPDLIILDLNIPKMRGLSLLQRWRYDAPVVIFTSSSNPQDRQRAFDLGVKDYVQKPSHFDEYAEAVSGMVRSVGRIKDAPVAGTDP